MKQILTYPDITFVEFPKTEYFWFRMKELFQKDQYFKEKIQRFLQSQRPLLKFLALRRGVVKPFITVKIQYTDLIVKVWYLPTSVMGPSPDRPFWMELPESTWGLHLNDYGYLHYYGHRSPNIEGLEESAYIVYDKAMEMIRGKL